LKISRSGKIVGMSGVRKKMDDMLDGIKELYEFVQNDNPYTGADIWNWFQKDAENYLRKGFHNYIICLSDGYLKFTPEIEDELRPGEFMLVGEWRDDPAWTGKITPLLSIGKDFSDYNATFMMMEINLYRNERTGKAFPYDFDIIKAHWEPWLEGMGITDITFKQQVPEEVLEDVINSFLVPRGELE